MRSQGAVTGLNLTRQTKLIDEPIPKGGIEGGKPPFSSRTSLDFIRYPAITKSDQWHGWELPGYGKARDDCGLCRHKGCLNRPRHPNGQIFVKAFKASCCKKSCPICWTNWSMKEAHRAAHRMRSFKPDKYRAPIHVVFSPPKGDYERLGGIREIRKFFYELTKRVGLFGGLSVFHPVRCQDASWTWSPHFHVLGYGWIEGTKQVTADNGWIVKNLGVRKSVVGTVNYLLSHAGIREHFHTVTWFGRLGYGVLKVSKEDDPTDTCPYCQEKLVNLEYLHKDRPPPLDDNFEGLTDPEGWYILVSDYMLGRTGLDREEYASVLLKRYENQTESGAPEKALNSKKNLNLTGE